MRFKKFDSFVNETHFNPIICEIDDKLGYDNKQWINKSPLAKKMLVNVEGLVDEDQTEVYLTLDNGEVISYEYTFNTNPSSLEVVNYDIRIDNKKVTDEHELDRFVNDILPGYKSVTIALIHFYFEKALGILNATEGEKKIIKGKFLAGKESLKDFSVEIRGRLKGKNFGF